MILRMVTKVSLEEDDGTVVKEQEWGNAYMDDIDMAKAATDHWHVRYNNRGDPIKRLKQTPKHCFRIRRIVNIMVDQLEKFLLQKFLCDRAEIYEEYQKALAKEDHESST